MEIDMNIVGSYKNWKGDTRKRYIRPKQIWFGSTQWHEEKQWLLKAVDLESGLARDYALTDFDFTIPQNLDGITILEEMKPCPLCGGESKLVEWDCPNSSSVHAKIYCYDCDVSVEEHQCARQMEKDSELPTHVQLVTRVWNKRVK